MRKTPSEKKNIVKYFLRNKSAKKTAGKYNCSESSIRRWVKLYSTEGLTPITTKLTAKKKKYFVSVDQYLSDKPSLGPQESSGKIDYHYQNLTNIYNYLFLFLQDKEIKKFACMPDYGIIVRNGVARTACCIDLFNKEIFFPKKLVTGIHKCMKKSTVRFIYFSLFIYPNKKNFAHVNAIVIDTKNKTLERFEPYGDLPSPKDKIINQIMEHYAIDYLVLHKYTYLPPSKISPPKGIQTMSDSYNGMCVTISILYFKMRVLNPNMKPITIIKKFTNMKPQELKILILRFAKYIEITLKKNKKIVKKLDYNLFYKMISNDYSKPNLTISQFEKKYNLIN